jgi:glutamine synthetase
MHERSTDSDPRQHVIQACRDHDVKFIRLWFTDILGILKSVAITLEELEHALDDGITFDGTAIEGYARHGEADMIARPDPATFQLLPWRPRPQAVARMFCSVHRINGEPFSADPRYVLQRVLAQAAERGYTFYVSPEVEFFYFKDSQQTEPLDHGGYFDLTPMDSGSNLRRETVLMLEEMGIGVALSHHEVAPSQHEMDLRYTDALSMADSIMTFRLIVKEVAMRHNVYATFMPKPMQGHNGSAMHLQLSLFRGEDNAFADPTAAGGMSEDGRKFTAGLLRHAPEITLVTNQWVNSYKRLVPGYEAPTYTSWSFHNNSDLVRVPANRPGTEMGARVEYRSPDAACNPYLAFAAVLAAGLAGIEGNYDLAPASETPVSAMSDAERAARGIESIPSSLGEAIERFEASTLMRETLGDRVFEGLIQNKKMEWAEYSQQVSQFELDRYLPLL